MSTIQLKGITWDHSRGFDPLVAASKLYAENNNVEISWEKRSLKNFGDQSLENLANNFDLLIVDHPHSGTAASLNCVIPLDEYVSLPDFEKLKDQSGGPSFNSYNYKDHQWAFPIDAAMQCAVYREDLLQQPIPLTWDQVLKIDGLGMAFCPTDSLCTFLSLTAQFGTAILEENNFLVDEKKGVKVIELMKLLNSRSHPKSIDWNPIQLFDHMSENDDITYAPLAFCYTNYSREGYKKNKLNFTNAPNTTNALLGGAGIAVSANCKEKVAAAVFSKWVCSDIIQKTIYVEHQGQPANIEAWKDAGANNLTNNFFESTIKTLKNAYVRPRFESWPHFQEDLGNVLHDCLNKGLDALKVIKHLNQKYRSIRS